MTATFILSPFRERAERYETWRSNHDPLGSAYVDDIDEARADSYDLDPSDVVTADDDPGLLAEQLADVWHPETDRDAWLLWRACHFLVERLRDEAAETCGADGCDQEPDAHQSCEACGADLHEGDDIVFVGGGPIAYDGPESSYGGPASPDSADFGQDAYCSVNCLVADLAAGFGFVEKEAA